MHIVVMYSLVVVHTIDAVERSGKRERYQNYVWFVVPLLFYFCDYASEYLSRTDPHCFESAPFQSSKLTFLVICQF